MTETVNSFVEALSNAPLLAHVGRVVGSAGVVRVYSWKEALASCRAQEWDDFLNDRNNENAHVKFYNPSVGQSYVKLVDAVLPRIDALFERAAITAGLAKKDVETIVRYGPWISLRACDEIAHADRYKVHWHRDVSEWFLKGHFPCGWRGDWPEGAEQSGELVLF